MTAHIVFPGAISPDKFSSATDQAGGRLRVTKGTANVGSLSLHLAGTPTADSAITATIGTAGDVQAATFTIGVGGTAYGRETDDTWATATLLADTAALRCSRPVEIDTDDDGIPDRVLVAINRASTSPDVIEIRYTDTFDDGGSTWSTLNSDATGSDTPYAFIRPALVVRGNQLYLFAILDDDSLVVYYSADHGATWGSKTTITTGVVNHDIDAIVLLNGLLCVTYTDSDGSNDHIFCKTSSGGTTWVAAKQVTAAGSVNYGASSIVQESDGKTIVFVHRETATAAIQARQTTDANPATGTWATYSETLWTGGTTDTTPSACIAPDGTIYCSFIENALAVKFSKFKDGDANWSADATIYDPTNDIQHASLGCIGGALWCMTYDAIDMDCIVAYSKYWKTSESGESWTSTAPQYLRNGVWCYWGGADGQVADTFTGTVMYDYGGDRMVALRPSHPTRSKADEQNWSVVFDLGANVRVPVDTICVYANVDHLHFQMNASDSWGSPSVNTSVSFVKETISSYSVVAGKFTRTSGTWKPHELAGLRGRFATSGAQYTIRDNDASNAYIDSDISAEAGDFTILSPRAWATQTASAYRYIRILIDSQITADGYYQIGALLVGMRHAAAARLTSRVSWVAPTADENLLDGGTIRSSYGAQRRKWAVSLAKPTVAEYTELMAGLRLTGAKPFAFIPSTTDATDWSLVYADDTTEWVPTKTVFKLSEAV